MKPGEIYKFNIQKHKDLNITYQIIKVDYDFVYYIRTESGISSNKKDPIGLVRMLLKHFTLLNKPKYNTPKR